MIDYPVTKMTYSKTAWMPGVKTTDYENEWLPCDKDDWLWEMTLQSIYTLTINNDYFWVMTVNLGILTAVSQ